MQLDDVNLFGKCVPVVRLNTFASCSGMPPTWCGLSGTTGSVKYKKYEDEMIRKSRGLSRTNLSRLGETCEFL